MPASIAGLGLRAVGPDHSFFTPEVTVSPLVQLLRHLRQTIITVLPEITQIPETQDAFPTRQESNINSAVLDTPFLVLLGKTPRPAESAVGEVTQTLPIDFIYVRESVVDGIVDMQEYVRDRLVMLQNALLADYRQAGLANDTRLIETPLDHTNQYKKIFANEAQPVTALVLQMEFDVIQSLLT